MESKRINKVAELGKKDFSREQQEFVYFFWKLFNRWELAPNF